MRSIIATNNQHIRELVEQAIAQSGPCVDLNHIDVSMIYDMSSVFSKLNFRGDISQWDVSKVRRMDNMFFNCSFNGDISQWNTEELRVTPWMFSSSQFNGDISQWNTANLYNTRCMFENTYFNGDVSKWNIAAFESCDQMFSKSANTIDLSAWVLPKNCKCYQMLDKGFTGLLPRVENSNVDALMRYKQMFSEPAQLRIYLENTPFSHAHAKLMMAVKTKPIWADPKIFKSVKALQKIAMELGFNDNQIVEKALKQHCVKSEPPIAEDMYAIDDLLND